MSGKLRRFKVFTTSGCLNRTHHTDITITRTDDPSDKITIARDIKDCTELAGELDPPFNVIGGKSYIISLDSQGLNPNEQIAGVAGVYYTFFLDSASRITRPSASTIAPASVVMVRLNFIDMPGLIQGKSELFLFLSSGSPAERCYDRTRVQFRRMAGHSRNPCPRCCGDGQHPKWSFGRLSLFQILYAAHFNGESPCLERLSE